MASLKGTVIKVMSGYAVKGFNGYSVLTSTADQRFFTIVSVANVKGQRLATTSMIVHLEHHSEIIEHDINSKPLVDALVQAGIFLAKSILPHAGEPVPETAK